MIRQTILALAFLAAPALSQAPAMAGDKPIAVVELFTSQGCSSCPPADALFGELVAEGEVVALAYHVDYWDYLGWKDTLGSPGSTARQRAYGRALGQTSIYTPQVVVNGRTHMAGSNSGAVRRAIETRADTVEGLTVDLSATYAGENLVIEAGAGQIGQRKAHVILVSFDAAHVVQIQRGENRDRTLTYHNAVTAMQTVGVWKGRSARFELPMNEIAAKGTGGCAVLLQAVGTDGLPGPILGATMVMFPSG
ncbi:MAG: DUF1223 domain-containing protein [Rhizobiaceae bacterium]|nr:DUF1223 domain-containing protein [Rhizobiaceae bacterium]